MQLSFTSSAVRGAVYRAPDPGVRGSREFSWEGPQFSREGPQFSREGPQFSREGPEFSRGQFPRLCSRSAAILTWTFTQPLVLESSGLEAFPCRSL